MWRVGESRLSFGVAWNSGGKECRDEAGSDPYCWLGIGWGGGNQNRKHLTPKLGAVICRVRESQYTFHAD